MSEDYEFSNPPARTWSGEDMPAAPVRRSAPVPPPAPRPFQTPPAQGRPASLSQPPALGPLRTPTAQATPAPPPTRQPTSPLPTSRSPTATKLTPQPLDHYLRERIEERAQDHGMEVMTIMGEALSKLGKGMERILRNKLDAIPQAPAITLVLAPLGKLMADKIYDATIASNLAKLPNVKDALLAMTDEDLRKITLPEIERILTRLPRSPNFSTGMSASSGTLDL